MSLRELCDRSADVMRDIKEQAVADAQGKRERPELRPVVRGWRGLEAVVTMIPMQVDRDAALMAARLAAGGFGCDTLTMSTDSWAASTKHNPVTGQPWKAGDMQDLVHNHQGIERGWISESLHTNAVNRAGDLAVVDERFTLTQRTNALGVTTYTLTWGDRTRLGHDGDYPDAEASGIVPENLLAAMRGATLAQTLARFGLGAADFGLGDVEGQAHQDCAVVRSMVGVWEGVAMLESSDPQRTAIIERSLGHMRMDR